MSFLAWVQLEEEFDWRRWAFVIAFLALPVAARILRAILAAAGVLKPEAPEAAEPRPGASGEQRRAEAEGEELWRRLLEGEEPEPAREAVPAPVPAAPSRSLEHEEEPAPLSVLGEVVEPASAAEVSLEEAVEPAPLEALGREIQAPPAPVPRAAFALRGGEMRRAVLLSEILSPPLALRNI